jgi:hypothetical protein
LKIDVKQTLIFRFAKRCNDEKGIACYFVSDPGKDKNTQVIEYKTFRSSPADYLTKLAEAETVLLRLYCFIFASSLMQKEMEITIIKAVLVLIFGLSVLGKITGKTKLVFEKAGYGTRILYATAIAEIILTVGMFTKYELYATVGLLGVIGGAVFTLIRLKVKPAKYIMALVTAILLLVLLGLQLSQ